MKKNTANISTVISLIQSVIKKNNSKNIIFLIGFIFLASLFEVIALICIAPIMKLVTGNLETNDKASAIIEKIFPFVTMDNSLNVFSLFFLLAIIASLLLVISNLFAQKIKYQYCAEVLKDSVTDIFNSSSIFAKSSSSAPKSWANALAGKRNINKNKKEMVQVDFTFITASNVSFLIAKAH